MDNLVKEKSRFIKMLLLLSVILSIYFIMLTVSEIKSYGLIGGGVPTSNTISFDGKGEVSASPDIATINFTLTASEKDLKTAQDKVTAKEKSALSFLDTQKIEKKDIKTENYSTYPKYDYGYPCYNTYNSMGLPCRSNAPTIVGYEVSENISVKVRDIAKAGDVVRGIGDIGVSNINGPNFSIDKEDELKAQARKLAIDDAKTKAKILAKDLGVNLVRIVSFSEGGNYSYPMYSNAMGAAKADVASAPAPVLPTGENKITSRVTITYEIR